MFSMQGVLELRRSTPRKVRVAVGASVLAAALIGVYASLAPSSKAAPTVLDERSGITSSQTIAPWSEQLSPDAVDANGIELDLDGNASAFVPAELR